MSDIVGKIFLCTVAIALVTSCNKKHYHGKITTTGTTKNHTLPTADTVIQNKNKDASDVFNIEKGMFYEWQSGIKAGHHGTAFEIYTTMPDDSVAIHSIIYQGMKMAVSVGLRSTIQIINKPLLKNDPISIHASTSKLLTDLNIKGDTIEVDLVGKIKGKELIQKIKLSKITKPRSQ